MEPGGDLAGLRSSTPTRGTADDCFPWKSGGNLRQTGRSAGTRFDHAHDGFGNGVCDFGECIGEEVSSFKFQVSSEDERRNVVIFNDGTLPTWEFAPTSSHKRANRNECLHSGQPDLL